LPRPSSQTAVFNALARRNALRTASEDTRSGATLRDLANRDFTIVREDDIIFDVIQRIWRKRAGMALVVRGHGVPRPGDVAGVITKEHVADSVASSIQVYPT
jgi:chloride channel protein, CIC family